MSRSEHTVRHTRALTRAPICRAQMSDDVPFMDSNAHVVSELYEWNLKGSNRLDAGGCIPIDPKFFFKINVYVKPSKHEPVKVHEEARNSMPIDVGGLGKGGGVEEGIALWAKRSEIVESCAALGVPGKTNGGYTQHKIAELPDTLYVELMRKDPRTSIVNTDALSCPRTLDFADGGYAAALDEGVAPCKYRLVGAQVGELRKQTSDDQFVTWWAYVYDDDDGTWREMTDEEGFLNGVRSDVIAKHLDPFWETSTPKRAKAGEVRAVFPKAPPNKGTTFPIKLYYRKVEVPEPALPPMPKELVDFDAPRTCIRVPCSGPLERIPWGPNEEPWGDQSAESCTLASEIIRHPERGAYGVLYVHLHVVVSYPGDPEPAFNRNLGNRGDMYITTCFETEFGAYEEPEDAILNVDREPWPEEPDGAPIPESDPRIPKWAKDFHVIESFGMPIPQRLWRKAAIALAHLQHVRWNPLRERLTELWTMLHKNIHDLIPNVGNATHVMKVVNRRIALCKHHHLATVDKAALIGRRGDDLLAGRLLPMPRSVEALTHVMWEALEAADFEANKFGFACAARPDPRWFVDAAEYEFEFPERSLCCTADDLMKQIARVQGHVDASPFCECPGILPSEKILNGVVPDARIACPMAENERDKRAMDASSPHAPYGKGMGPEIAAARAKKRAEETASTGAKDPGGGQSTLQRLAAEAKHHCERVDAYLEAEAKAAADAKRAVAEEERARWANSSMRGRNRGSCLSKREAEAEARMVATLREEQQRKQEEREQAKAAETAAAKAVLKEKLAREKGEAEAAALGKAQGETRRWAEEVAAKAAAAEARALAKEERKAARRLNRKKTPAQLQAEADAAAQAKHEAEMAEMVARVQKKLGITLDESKL